MKKITNLLLIVLLIGTIVISCEENNDKNTNDTNDKQLVISGKLTGNTKCKNESLKKLMNDKTPNNLSLVEYSFDSEKNKLTLKHINAGFNCCPDGLYCKIESKDGIVVIHEFEKASNCKCNCLYDLDIEVNGIDLKKYQIKFVEPYALKQNKLEFEIDLTKNSKGKYSVIRKKYPWGVDSNN